MSGSTKISTLRVQPHPSSSRSSTSANPHLLTLFYPLFQTLAGTDNRPNLYIPDSMAFCLCTGDLEAHQMGCKFQFVRLRAVKDEGKNQQNKYITANNLIQIH